MTRKARHWAPLQQQKGESNSSWLRRNHEFHKEMGIEDKILRGDWLPQEEYKRQTGRPGRKLDAHYKSLLQIAADEKTAQQANAPSVPRKKPPGTNGGTVASIAIALGVPLLLGGIFAIFDSLSDD